MYTIQLENLRFYAYHGVHDEEKQAGTEFEVNIRIDFISEEPVVNLDQTINYVTVYELARTLFAEPVRLLEKIAAELTDRIKLLHKDINMIKVQVIKISPPIPHFTGNVSVSFSKSF